MKKFFSIILGLSLITSPVSIAQNNQQSTSQNNIQSNSQTTQNTQTLSQENVNQVKSEMKGSPDTGKNEKYDKQSQSQGGYDFYSKQILAIGTSIIGANIIGQCSFGLKVPSIATFMAGSLVHIASEILGGQTQNKNHNKRLEDLKLVEEDMKNKQGGQLQRETIEQRKKEEEQNRDFMQSRFMWMVAVTVIYYAAMGLAISEELTGHSSGVAAGATACAPTAATLAAPCTYAYAACYASHYAVCTGSAPTGAITAEGNFANPAAIATGTAACTALNVYSPGCTSYLTAYAAIAYANCMPFSPASGVLGMLMAKAVTMAYSMGLSRTGGSPISSYTVMFLGLLLFIVPSLQNLVMAAYNFPIPRAITFGVSAVLATAVTMGLSQRKKIAEENIKKLEALLKNFNQQTEDSKGVDQGEVDNSIAENTTTGATPLSPGALNSPENKKLSQGSTTQNRNIKNCLSSSKDSFQYSPEGCSHPMKIPKPQFDMKLGIKSLNYVGMMANDMANAVSTGDSERANILAGQIANQAANIRGIVENLKSKLNAKLKSEGKKPINFDQEMSGQMARNEKILEQAAAAKGIPMPGRGQSALGSQDIANLANELKDNKTKDQQSIVEIPQNKPSTPEETFGSEDTSSQDEITDEEKVVSMEEKLNEVEFNEADINLNSSASLFELISNRYSRSYSKLLNRKKEPEAQK